MNPEDLGALIPLILIAALFWLLILRPARRRQQQAAALQKGLGVGDRVMLTSGLFGTVTGLSDEAFDLEVANGVTLAVHRQAVAKIVTSAARPDSAAGPGEPGTGSSAPGRHEDEAGTERGSRSDDGGEAQR